MTELWQTELKIAHREKNDSSFTELIPRDLYQRLEENPALVKQFQFHKDELKTIEGLLDPIGDEQHSPVPGLIHRYENRALFIPTQTCPVHCRYCFRRNMLSQHKDFLQNDFDLVIDYLKMHTEINELIFTGGDPLILSDQKIENYLRQFSTISHLKTIRFHTRTPVVLPSRVTQKLIDTLRVYQARFKILMVIHINHPSELNTGVKLALNIFDQNRITILSQTVLLKGINDSVGILKELVELLVQSEVRPYYLHHPDLVKGAMHFHLSLEEGRKIYAQLRNCLSGWALPQYIIDIPGGAGKVSAFNPESYVYSGNLIDRQGQVTPTPL